MEVGKWQPAEAQLITRSLSRSPGLRLSLSVCLSHAQAHSQGVESPVRLPARPRLLLSPCCCVVNVG